MLEATDLNAGATLANKILLFGYYHKRNLGDDLLLSVLEHLFSKHMIAVYNFLPPVSTLNKFDYVVWGGGSLWNRNAPLIRKYAEYRKALQNKLLILGISANEPVCKETTRQIVSDARVVIVRDSLSLDYLHQNANVVCAPDLTWYTPLPLAKAPASKLAVGVNLRDTRHSQHYKDLISCVNKYTDNIIGLPFFEGEFCWSQQRTDTEVMSQAGVHTFSSMGVQTYQNVKLFIGMRYHSIVLAAQAGIPFIGFDYHPKTKAFCQDIGMSQYCVSLERPKELYNTLQTLHNDYSSIREHLVSVSSYLSSDAAQKYSVASKIVEQPSMRRRSLRKKTSATYHRITRIFSDG